MRRKISAVFIAASLAAVAVCSTLLSGCSSSVDWALKTVRNRYYKEIILPEGFGYNKAVDGSEEQFLKKFVATYLDIYSAYYTKEEYMAIISSNSGSKSGLGLAYIYLDEGFHPQGGEGVYIETVVGNSPAFKSGLKVGEFVRSGICGGQSTEFNSSEAFSDFIDARATGEKFTLVTDRGTHEMSKENYTASYVSMTTCNASWDVNYDSGEALAVKSDGGNSALPDGAAYMRLEQFFGNAPDEMALLMREFNAEHCTSLILDLRGDGGGYVDVMQSIAGIFTGRLPAAEPNAMVAVYRGGVRTAFPVRYDYVAECQLPIGTKVSVLADNGTASASEALIGVLVDNGVIDYGDIYISDLPTEYLNLVGGASMNCRTYGKGIMQSTFVRPFYGDAIKLTTAEIYWPKGVTSIHGVGLNTSMGCKTVKTDWDFTYGDEQLASAIEIIYGE